MTTVRLRLHTTDLHTTDDERERAERLIPVDLDRLTARARALAEILAAAPVKAQTSICIESTRTVREMDPDASPLWHTTEELDRPHRTQWSAWSAYPVGTTVDVHDYLEEQAAKLPIGYYPIGRDSFARVPGADAARDEADLVTRTQVIELLRQLGRPLSVDTIDNYRSRPPKGWPQPVRYVGRRPMWDRRDIEAYADHRSPTTAPDRARGQ